MSDYRQCPECDTWISVDLLGVPCEDHGPEEQVDLGGGMVVPISEVLDNE